MLENINTNQVSEQTTNQSDRTHMYIALAILIVVLLAGGLGYFLLKGNNSLSVFKSKPSESNQINVANNSDVQDQQATDISCDPNKVYDDLDEALKEPLKVCRLDLTGKNLSALPKKVEEMKNLKVIYLTSNIFTDIPPVLFELSQLEELYLPGNRISTISSDIKMLSKLKFLNITNNQVKMLPEEITSLTNLTTLLASRNELSSLPEGIDSLPLERLVVTNNNFSDTEIERIKFLFPPTVLSISRKEPEPTPLNQNDPLIKVAPRNTQ